MSKPIKTEVWSKHGFSIPLSLSLKGISRKEKDSLYMLCFRKIKHRSSREARRHVFYLQLISPNRHYGIYKCGLCGGWHVTSHYSKTDEEALESLRLKPRWKKGPKDQARMIRHKKTSLQIQHMFEKLNIIEECIEVI